MKLPVSVAVYGAPDYCLPYDNLDLDQNIADNSAKRHEILDSLRMVFGGAINFVSAAPRVPRDA